MTDMSDWDDDILGEDTTDDVIELTDIVKDSSEEPDDGIIELTDIVEDDPGQPLEAPVIELDDPVIELTDIVEENPASDQDLALDDMDEDNLDFGDDFSMEDEFAEEFAGESDASGIEPEMVIGLPDDEPDDVEKEDASPKEMIMDEMSIEDEMGIRELAEEEPSVQASAVDDIPSEGSPAAPINVAMEDLEAALERVIEKKFADRIDAMLFEVMEKVIKKEIKQIKTSLLKDLDQNEND